MSQQVTRREFLRWSTSGVALVAAAACMPGAPSGGTGGGSASEPKSLNVGQWGTAQRAELYKSAINVFQQSNPGVTANLQFADLASYLDRLTTQAASRACPTCCGCVTNALACMAPPERCWTSART
jgi:ABC-type glycerol-3-phosphate transport system substrate-binding protein